uniref:Uncharacterized protein n=1 Tax=Brassica oleracea var. oleracea TaxID=109376 RepID=A0A0D3BGU2_BRAOL
MVLIFHSFKDFSDLDLDMQVFQIWKTAGLENFQTTSRKYSRRLPGSFSDLGLIYMFFRSGSDFGRLIGSILKHNALEDFQEVFHTTSNKSSRRLPGSLLEDFLEVFSQSLIPYQVKSKLVFVEE